MGLVEIRARDGDRCARLGCSGSLHVHHRVRRSQGGLNSSANLITLCASCHHWVHANPYAANRAGLLLRQGEDPALIPVRHAMWPAAPVWLDADYGFTLSAPASEHAAA
jgi:hypothetical protein